MSKRKASTSKKGTTSKRQKTGKSTLAAMTRNVGGQASMKPELKQIDVNATSIGTINSATTTWSALLLLNGCANGTAINQRVGRKLTMKKFFCRYLFQTAGAALTSIGELRLLIIYDKAPNLAAPVIGDILNVDSITATMNLANADRFVILADEYPMKARGGSLEVAVPNIMNGINREFAEGLVSIYSGTGGAITDMTNGAIFAMWCTTAQTIGTNGSAIIVSTRVRYSDA